MKAPPLGIMIFCSASSGLGANFSGLFSERWMMVTGSRNVFLI
jgi:hypothetical protein